jgi:hypothetical protein
MTYISSYCNCGCANQNFYIKNYKKPKKFPITKIVTKFRLEESFSYVKNYSQKNVEELYNAERFLSEQEDNHSIFIDSDYFRRHPAVDPVFRLVVLDWIMEICEISRFKRATYHLSVVLLDVIMSRLENVQFNKFQLIAVTCLILAVKFEVNKN